MHRSTRLLALLAAVVGVSFATPTGAHADEIEVIDLETCVVSTMQVYEITGEDQMKVYYKMRRSGDTEEIPTMRVLSVTRSGGGAQAEILDGARSDIAQGNYSEALVALQGLHGGGWKEDVNTNDRYFTPYNASDPRSSRSRPTWTSEYAHYFYALALYSKAKAEDREDLFEEALQALENQEIQVAVVEEDGTRSTKKGETGGFLERFSGGNSRWYPDAMALYARTLTALGRYDDAQKVFSDLFDASIFLHPRYAYVACLGDGEIGEAKGSLDTAISGYESGTVRIMQLLRRAEYDCMKMELGRYYSLVRNRVSQMKLEEATSGGGRNAAKFRALRSYIEDGQPENLRKRFSSEPSSTLNAIVQGAGAPEVQAVNSLGLGLALLADSKYDEALVMLKAVIVKYFARERLAARACSALVEAATEAAKSASAPEAKAFYRQQADLARATLRTQYAHIDLDN